MNIIVVIFLVLGAAKADEDHAYFIANLTYSFLCEPLRKTSFCPGLDIRVLNASLSMSTINIVNSSFENLRLADANESCLEALRKTTCLGIVRCEPDRQYVDVNAAVGECEKGNGLCPQFVNQGLLNCTDKRQQYERMSVKPPRLAECKTVQDSSGFCPNVNYKYAIFHGLNLTKHFLEIKRALQPAKPNISSDCYDKIKLMSCQRIPVCSDDEKYAVSLVSKQQCEDRFKCIQENMRTGLNVSEICRELPDKVTAKKVPLPSGVIRPTSGPTDGLSSGPTDRSSSGTTGGLSSGPTDRSSSGTTGGLSSGPTDRSLSGQTDGDSSEPTNGPTTTPNGASCVGQATIFIYLALLLTILDG